MTRLHPAPPTPARRAQLIKQRALALGFARAGIADLTPTRHGDALPRWLAGEMAAGKRKRMSFAPMVLTTGMLMAYEALAIVLGQETETDNRGWFFNPYKGKVERPLPRLIEMLVLPIARRQIKKLTGG